MKKLLHIYFLVFSCFMTCFHDTMIVNATSAESIKERWYDTRYYPLYEGNEEWQKHDMFDTLDILNPPLDLLLSMPTEELSALMQEYPLMPQIMTYYAEDGSLAYDIFYSFLELNSDIFYELLRRDDGITCLLKEYQTNEVDIELMDDPSNELWLKEIFGCQFIRYYAHHFTEDEYELTCQIIEEKKEIYSQLNDGFQYYLDLPEITTPPGDETDKIKTNYLTPEEIQEKEAKFAATLLQLKSAKDSQTDISDTEDSHFVKQEDNKTTSSDTTDTRVSANVPKTGNRISCIIIGTVCVIGATVYVLQKKRR